MNKDSGFDDKEFIATPYLKLIEDKEGATCLCYQMRLHGKLHFVKKIKPEFENDARMRAAFRKENEIGYSLSHPNLPKYVFLDGFLSPEEYVVTEWIEGQPLDSFLKNNPDYFKNKDNLLRFIREISETLDYLHNHGVVHGDLKPSNIMIAANTNNAKVLDLGFAKTDAHTLTGGFSSMYASPEIISGSESNPASDYYTLGKILEFIEKHIDAKLSKEIINLKDALINPEISCRIGTKEEIYKILEKKRGKWVWMTGLALLGLTGGFIIVTSNKDGTQENDININQQPIIKEEIDKVQSLAPEIESYQTEEPIYQKKDNKVPLVKTEISRIKIESEKEKIKEEVNRLLELNYATHINRIDSLTEANVFTKDWYFKIVNESGEAMVNSIKDSYYYEKYPTVPKEDVIYIVANEFKDFSKIIWQPKLDSYRKNIPH